MLAPSQPFFNLLTGCCGDPIDNILLCLCILVLRSTIKTRPGHLNFKVNALYYQTSH